MVKEQPRAELNVQLPFPFLFFLPGPGKASTPGTTVGSCPWSRAMLWAEFWQSLAPAAHLEYFLGVLHGGLAPNLPSESYFSNSALPPHLQSLQNKPVWHWSWFGMALWEQPCFPEPGMFGLKPL